MRRTDHRLVAALVGVVLLLGVLVGRLAQMQVVQGEGYRAQAATGTTRTATTTATRGRILDVRGVPLVDNENALTITADRSVLGAQPDGGRAQVQRLAEAVGRDATTLWDRLHLCGEEGSPPPPRCWNGSPSLPVPLATRVDPSKALAIAEEPDRWPGLAVVPEAQRHYPAPEGAVAAQLLGYLGQAAAEDVSAGRARAGEWLGKAGLEATYDADLRGADGRTVLAIGPDGTTQAERSRTEPTPGHDLVTTLDAGVQGAAEKALADAVRRARAGGHPADAAAAVVLDVRTGAVVASASNPTYDPKVWVGGISAADLAAVSKALPDQVTGHLAPPASTFKALSVQAALAAGAKTDERYGCPSAVTIAGRRFTNFESAAFGDIDLREALAVSCDTIFYRFAADRWAQLAADGGDSTSRAAASDAADEFVSTATRFGLGRPTGIDLPTDAAGRVPGRVWKLERWRATKTATCERARTGYPEVRDAERRAYLTAIAKEQCQAGYVYRPGDAVNLSVGQGDTLVTPLQLARSYAAIANGGTLWTPHVGAKVVDASGATVRTISPRAASRVAIPAATKRFLDDGLSAVVTEGTARGAFSGFPLEAYPVAGKTGTGEVYGEQDTAWFASYGPVSSPRYAVVVMVSQGGTGGGAAAPAARAIWDVLRTR